MSPARARSPESCWLASAPGWPLVLYFHHVHPAVDHYTNLTPDSFLRGLDIVLAAFEPVALESLLDPDGTVRRPGRPTVLLTFDDGYADLLDVAVPALAERAVPAVFFVCTHLLGHSSADPRHDYLSWPDCSDLIVAGHAIGSHGCTHRKLTGLAPAEVEEEVAHSLGDLRQRLGLPRAVYAYPYGVVGEIPVAIDGFTGPVTAFGTVKAAPLPWPQAPLAIRRTYLPTGADGTWPELVAHWRATWEQR